MIRCPVPATAALVLLLSACQPAPPQLPTGTLAELESGYAPFAGCVQDALSTRQDFDGQLPRMIVDAGIAPTLQDTQRRYLGSAADVASLDADATLRATQQSLMALSAFGAGGRDGSDTPSIAGRRAMVRVEVMQLVATATGLSCAPSDSLIRAMEKAKDEYF